MKNVTLESFGPIAEAHVEFGDLTVLVGQQASGKSIFIQLMKLLVDKHHIRKTLEQYSYVWSKDTDKILEWYFGEGMSGVWKSQSTVTMDGKDYTKEFLLPKSGRTGNTVKKEETMFYIPAQRILSIADGRPKSFMEFDASAPYVLRQFSETLRQLLQSNITSTNAVFPVDNRLKEPLRKSFSESIFHEGRIMLDDRTGQKKLRMEVDGMSVPYITWSAGQKEFMPLLLGFYWLCPPSSTARRNSISHVVIEEPEMGLHPQAILSVILQILDLLSRGYKVILSTHSPVVLEFAWAFSILKKTTSDIAPLFELFNVPKDGRTKKIFENIIKSKKITTYYFHRTNEKVHAKNISSLDAGNDDKAISEWGGISSFATTAADIVSKYISKT